MAFNLSGESNYLDDKIQVAKIRDKCLRKNGTPIIIIKSRYMEYGASISNNRYIVNSAIEQIECEATKRGINITSCEVHKSNNYYMAVVTTDCSYATKLKKLTLDIENYHRIGSIMDLDVVDINGISISRKSRDIEPRKCIICGEYSTICLHKNSHNQNEYDSKVKEIIHYDKFGC